MIYIYTIIQVKVKITVLISIIFNNIKFKIYSLWTDIHRMLYFNIEEYY